MNALESESRLVQVLHAAAEGERAGGVVGPLVVRADDAAAGAAAGRDELRAAMAADVVQRPDGSVLAADHDDRVGIDLEREPVAGVAQLAGMPGEQPALAPNLLYINAVERLVAMEGARQAPPRPIRRELVREFPLQALLHPVTMPSDNKNKPMRY